MEELAKLLDAIVEGKDGYRLAESSFQFSAIRTRRETT